MTSPEEIARERDALRLEVEIVANLPLPIGGKEWNTLRWLKGRAATTLADLGVTISETARQAALEYQAAVSSLNRVTDREIDAAALRDAEERGRRKGIEAAAGRLTEIADGLRYSAEKTISEWTGPDLEQEDRQANYASAREDRRRSFVYDDAAASVKALASQPPGREG